MAFWVAMTSSAGQDSGTAYEWVGWSDLTETITSTFTLQAVASIGVIEIGIYHRDGL